MWYRPKTIPWNPNTCKPQVGLEKLSFTSGAVASMRAELQALAPVLQRTVAEVQVGSGWGVGVWGGSGFGV